MRRVCWVWISESRFCFKAFVLISFSIQKCCCSISKYGISEEELKLALEEMLASEELDSAEEVDEDIELGEFELEGIDEFDLITDLASLIVSDKKISVKEVDILHLIGTSIGLAPELVTIAIINNLKFDLDLKELSIEE